MISLTNSIFRFLALLKTCYSTSFVTNTTPLTHAKTLISFLWRKSQILPVVHWLGRAHLNQRNLLKSFQQHTHGFALLPLHAVTCHHAPHKLDLSAMMRILVPFWKSLATILLTTECPNTHKLSWHFRIRSRAIVCFSQTHSCLLPPEQAAGCFCLYNTSRISDTEIISLTLKLTIYRQQYSWFLW